MQSSKESAGQHQSKLPQVLGKRLTQQAASSTSPTRRPPTTPTTAKQRPTHQLKLPRLSLAAQFTCRQLQTNNARLNEMSLPPLSQPAAAPMPRWWTDARPSLILRARVVDYWAEHNGESQCVVDYFRQLGFTVDFETSRRQEPSACAFVAARTVNDLHAAGDQWFTQPCGRAAEHVWIERGNMILGKTAPTEVHEGFMATNDERRRDACAWLLAE